MKKIEKRILAHEDSFYDVPPPANCHKRNMRKVHSQSAAYLQVQPVFRVVDLRRRIVRRSEERSLKGWETPKTREKTWTKPLHFECAVQTEGPSARKRASPSAAASLTHSLQLECRFDRRRRCAGPAAVGGSRGGKKDVEIGTAAVTPRRWSTFFIREKTFAVWTRAHTGTGPRNFVRQAQASIKPW